MEGDYHQVISLQENIKRAIAIPHARDKQSPLSFMNLV